MTTTQPPAAFPPGTWTITPDSTITTTVKKLKMITVTATLTVIDGSVTIAADGTPNAVTATIDAGSFDSGNPKRDTHIASDDFLDSETYPLIIVRADHIEARQTEGRVVGTATVKGNETAVDIAVTDIEVNQTSATLHATAVIDRNAVGLDKFPNFVIGADVAVAINAHLSHA